MQIYSHSKAITWALKTGSVQLTHCVGSDSPKKGTEPYIMSHFSFLVHQFLRQWWEHLPYRFDSWNPIWFLQEPLGVLSECRARCQSRTSPSVTPKLEKKIQCISHWESEIFKGFKLSQREISVVKKWSLQQMLLLPDSRSVTGQYIYTSPARLLGNAAPVKDFREVKSQHLPCNLYWFPVDAVTNGHWCDGS